MTVKYAELCSKSVKELARRKERKNRIAQNEANGVTIASIRRVKKRYGIV